MMAINNYDDVRKKKDEKKIDMLNTEMAEIW